MFSLHKNQYDKIFAMKFTFYKKFCDILRKKAVLAHYFKGKYDTVFSLGNNCELCIRLRDDFWEQISNHFYLIGLPF